MVTRILFDPRRDLPNGTTQSNPVTIEATPTGIREDGQVVIYPTTISTPITTGADIFQLPANTASNGWRLTVRDTITSAVKQQRVVRVPDQASILYQSLPDIDPASFTVTPGTARQWDATFWALIQAGAGGGLTDSGIAALIGNPASAVAVSLAATYLAQGTELRVSYYSKADGASTTVADTGQTIRMKTNGTGAAARVAGGLLINDSSTGVAANYATVNMGATINRIGGKFVLRPGGSTNPTGNFGSFTTPIWTQDITDVFPVVPTGRCHPFIGKYFCAFQIYEGGSGVPLVPIGYSSSTLYYDAPLVDDGVTVYEVEVIFPTPDTAILRAPDGRVYTYKDARLATYAAAGQYACFEHYQANAATDTGIGIVEIWASTAPQNPWRHNSSEGPARSLSEFQKRIPWAKREIRSIQRTDASAATTSGSPVVTDTSITAADRGRPVTGTGIPASSYVGTVTAGASFRLSSSATAQVDVNATATGASSLNIGTVSLPLTTSIVDVDYGSMQITAPSIPSSGIVAIDIELWVDMPSTATGVLIGVRRSTGSNLFVERVLNATTFTGTVRKRILVTNLTPTTSPTVFVVQAQALAAGAATIKIGSGGYVGHLSVEPILDGAAVAPAGVTPAVAATDNGDGTYGATGTSVTDNGDGTFTITDVAATDNGDGTFTLAA